MRSPEPWTFDRSRRSYASHSTSGTSLDFIETEDIDLSQYKESTELDVALRPVSSRVSFQKRTVRVSLKISAREVRSLVIDEK